MLPLALKTLQNIENIIDEEMSKIGAQKTKMPLLVQSDLWEKSGRWATAGPELFKLKDRKSNDACLAPTHEEVFTQLLGMEQISHKLLPQRLYQIGHKFRDEIRPRFGMLRSREFIMKDLYSFDKSETEALDFYNNVEIAYKTIFKRIGIETVKVDADSGNIGGSISHEFHALSEIGEDSIVICNGCGYASNVEKAVFQCQSFEEMDNKWFRTDKGTFDVVFAKGRSINIAALKSFTGAEVVTEVDEGTFDRIEIADSCITSSNLPKANLMNPQVGDVCAKCTNPLSFSKGIELGHIFYLGEKYSSAMNATFTDEFSTQQFFKMGCFGIGISRIMAVLAEISRDSHGLLFPPPVAPFLVSIVSNGSVLAEESVCRIYDLLNAQDDLKGKVLIIDDVSASFGRKMKSSSLIGVPKMIVLGRSLEKGLVEIEDRKTREKVFIREHELVEHLSTSLKFI